MIVLAVRSFMEVASVLFGLRPAEIEAVLSRLVHGSRHHVISMK